jgi:hypothetical protein
MAMRQKSGNYEGTASRTAESSMKKRKGKKSQTNKKLKTTGQVEQ